MKTYEYQILRYIPDQVSGEFLNVGIIVYGPGENRFFFEFINSKQRISSVFHGIESTHILRRLKSMQARLSEINDRKSNEPRLFNTYSVSYFSSLVLKKDDSALQFSEVKKGIDTSIESAFNDLKHRLLYKWVAQYESEYRSDEEVWRERYRKYFVEAGIADKMTSRSVKTRTDMIQFDQAYKNGVWNYFQPLNLNLKKSDSIKSKVYKWKGILSEIETAEEDLKLFFLTEMPESNNGISKFIHELLTNKTGNKIQSELITPDSVNEFLNRFKH